MQFNSFELDITEEGLTALLARLEAPGAPKGSDPDLPEQDALMQQLGKASALGHPLTRPRLAQPL